MYKREEYLNNDTREVIGIAYSSKNEIFFIEEYLGKKISMIPSDSDFHIVVNELSSHDCRFECAGFDNMTDDDIDDIFSPFLSKEKMEELRADLWNEDTELDLLFDEEEEEVLGPPKPNIPRKRLIEGLTLEWANFETRTFSNFRLSHFNFYNVIFKNCTLDNIDCWSGRFIACKFENCEILSFSGEGYAFRECEFTECRFGGIDYVDDVYHISNCKHINCTYDYDE